MFQRSRFRRRRSGVMLRSGLFLAAAALAVLAPLAAAAEPQPRRGGILEFAVDAEPPNTIATPTSRSRSSIRWRRIIRRC